MKAVLFLVAVLPSPLAGSSSAGDLGLLLAFSSLAKCEHAVVRKGMYTCVFTSSIIRAVFGYRKALFLRLTILLRQFVFVTTMRSV